MTGKVIYNLLHANSSIVALVGDRIYPVRRLQEEDLPAITYQTISNSPLNTKDGPSKLDTERITVHVFSNTHTQAQSLAALVRTTLDRYRGLNSGVDVDKIIFADENYLYEDWVEVHHIALDFLILVKR